MTKSIFLALALLLACVQPSAQPASAPAPAFDCAPAWSALGASGNGTAPRIVSLPNARAWAWWCQLPTRPTTPAGKVQWSSQVFTAHDSQLDPALFVAAAGRVAAASEPLAQANLELRNADAKSAAALDTPQKLYEWRQARWLGCEALRLSPYPANFDPPNPLPADWCGAQPTAPVTTAIWRTAGSLSVYSTSGGKLVRVLIGRKAPAGALCDCRAPIGSTYCPFAGANPNEAAFCAVAP